MRGINKKAAAVQMGGHDGSVSGQGQSERFGQAVHAVGGEQAAAGAATRTGALLEGLQMVIRNRRIRRSNHHIDQIIIFSVDAARFHGASGHKDGGNIQSHGSHQHAWRYLVAVRYAYHGIGTVGIDHVLDTIGNQVA